MAGLTSNIIIRRAYVAIGAWQGNSQEINAQYNADINFEQIVSESFPPQFMWDTLTGVEGEMATAVAMNQNNILRRLLRDTVTVTSGGSISENGDSGGRIIGELGQVFDADTGIELTPGLHEDEIRAIVNGPTGLFKSSTYSYALRPGRIFATVPNLQIDCCTFRYIDRAAAIEANGVLIFQPYENTYFQGLMANLKNQDASYTALSNEYAPMYLQWLAAQQGGRDVVAEAAA